MPTTPIEPRGRLSQDERTFRLCPVCLEGALDLLGACGCCGVRQPPAAPVARVDDRPVPPLVPAAPLVASPEAYTQARIFGWCILLAGLTAAAFAVFSR